MARLRTICQVVILLTSLLLAGIPSAGAAALSLSPSVQMDGGPLNSHQARPSIATGPDGTYHVVWSDDRLGGHAIFYARSSNGGATFSTARQLDPSWVRGSNQTNPSIALAKGGDLYVAWGDDRQVHGSPSVFLSASADGGASFSAAVKVDDALPGYGWRDFPSVATGANGEVLVAWQDARRVVGKTPSGVLILTADVYFAASCQGPLSFGPNLRVDDSGGYTWHTTPALTADASGRVFAIWSDNRSGDFSLYAATSLDLGATFGPSVRVDDSGASTSKQTDPTMAVDGFGRLHVAWQDNRLGPWTIFATRSLDGGRTFEPNVRVGDGANGQPEYAPGRAVTVNGESVVVWQDYRGGYDWDVYGSMASSAGLFSSNQRISDGASQADELYPSIAMDNSGNFLAVYQAEHPGNLSSTDFDIRSVRGSAGLSLPMAVTVAANRTSLPAGRQASLTVRVTLGSTPVAGATLTAFAGHGGRLDTPVDLGDGTYRLTYHAPTTSITLTEWLTITASKAGYRAGQGGIPVYVLPPALGVNVQASGTTVPAGGSLGLTATVTSGGIPQPSASVIFTDDAGGTFQPSSATTDGQGKASATYRSPLVYLPTTAHPGATATYQDFDRGAASVAMAVQPQLSVTTSLNRTIVPSKGGVSVLFKVTSGPYSVANANVVASAELGLLAPLRGLTDGSGYAWANYTAPATSTGLLDTIQVTAYRMGYQDAWMSKDLIVGSPSTLRVVALDPPSSLVSGSGQDITLRVTDLLGNVIANATVTLNAQGPLVLGASLVLSDAGGYIKVHLIGGAITANGTGTLGALARRTGYYDGQTAVTFTVALPTLDLLVNYTQDVASGGTITLRVWATWGGQPVAGALVVFGSDDGGSISPWRVTTGSDGWATASFTAPSPSFDEWVALTISALRWRYAPRTAVVLVHVVGSTGAAP